MIPSYCIGPRDLATTYDLMHDLADWISNRVQLTTNGPKVYIEAVEASRTTTGPSKKSSACSMPSPRNMPRKTVVRPARVSVDSRRMAKRPPPS